MTYGGEICLKELFSAGKNVRPEHHFPQLVQIAHGVGKLRHFQGFCIDFLTDYV